MTIRFLPLILMMACLTPYAGVVTENPKAKRDIQLVTVFTNVVITGDQQKARRLVSPAYMAYGPAASNSATLDQLLKTWTQTYKRQTNRKSRFITESFRVTSSVIRGDRVEQ